MATSRTQKSEDASAEASESTDTASGGQPEGGAPPVDEAMAEFRTAVREETKAGFLEAIQEAKPTGQSRQGNTEKTSFLPTWLEELFLGKPSD